MPLGRDAELDPGDIVFDGDQAPPERDTAAPPLVFGSCLLWPNDRPSQLLLSKLFCMAVCPSDGVRHALGIITVNVLSL